MTETKPLVYIASPYTEGSQSLNILSSLEVYYKLVDEALVTPYAPLFTGLLPGNELIKYDRWLALCFEVIQKCDALLALDAKYPWGNTYYIQKKSNGRDNEIKFAKHLGIPIFYDIKTLYEWVKTNPQL